MQNCISFPPFLITHMTSLFQKQSAKKDVYQVFAEKVRDHKELVSRWAVLQETRVEYFRGKDFTSFLRNHPEPKDILESDRNLEPEDIANALLRKNLLVRCDRVVKTVRPGKKKLSTWPAHLEIFAVCISVVYYVGFKCMSKHFLSTLVMNIVKYMENYLTIPSKKV